jgi:alpha/beta superfamily hydrolase
MQKKVFFDTSRGSRLCGLLTLPDSGEAESIVVTAAGYPGGNKENSTYEALEPILVQKGFAMLRFDYTGRGESSGEFSDLDLSRGIDDLHGALDFVKAEGFSSICLSGNSYGGCAAIHAAASRDDLVGLSLIAPVFNYYDRYVEVMSAKEIQDWKEKGYREYNSTIMGLVQIPYAFFEDTKNWDGYKDIEQVKIPTQVVIGSNDAYISPHLIEKARPHFKSNTEFMILEGSTHYFQDAYWEQMVQATVDFIEKILLSNE